MSPTRPRKRPKQDSGGTVYQRGKKWAYLINLDPDPLTGERQRDYRGGFNTEDDAWDALAEAKRLRQAGTYVRTNPRTVAEFFEHWLDTIEMSVKPTTHGNYRNYIHSWVVPVIGKRPLQDITTETINRLYAHLIADGRRSRNTSQAMYDEWCRITVRGESPRPRQLAEAAGVSYSAGVRALQRFQAGRVPAANTGGLKRRSVQSVHIMLNRAFSDAVAWKYISENPVKGAARIQLPKEGHSVWTPEQLRTFLRTAKDDRLYAMWLAFATTGMRRSEAAGARISLVNLDAGNLTLTTTRVVAAGKAIDSDGKSRGSRRTLALDQRTAAELAARLQEVAEEKTAFGTAYNNRGLLFCWPDGTPIHPDTITEQFNRLVDKAGVPPITLHSVRHTHATMSLRAGVNPKIVSRRLGHASVAFTLDTYTEDVPELHHDAAETVSQLFLDPDEHPRRRSAEPSRPPRSTRGYRSGYSSGPER